MITTVAIVGADVAPAGGVEAGVVRGRGVDDRGIGVEDVDGDGGGAGVVKPESVRDDAGAATPAETDVRASVAALVRADPEPVHAVKTANSITAAPLTVIVPTGLGRARPVGLVD